MREIFTRLTVYWDELDSAFVRFLQRRTRNALSLGDPAGDQAHLAPGTLCLCTTYVGDAALCVQMIAMRKCKHL